VSDFSYLAQRELNSVIKGLVSKNPEPMFLLTENILEARFSKHEILEGHSQKALELFYDVKNVILEREETGEFWRKFLFKLLLLDLLLVQKA